MLTCVYVIWSRFLTKYSWKSFYKNYIIRKSSNSTVIFILSWISFIFTITQSSFHESWNETYKVVKFLRKKNLKSLLNKIFFKMTFYPAEIKTFTFEIEGKLEGSSGFNLGWANNTGQQKTAFPIYPKNFSVSRSAVISKVSWCHQIFLWP